MRGMENIRNITFITRNKMEHNSTDITLIENNKHLDKKQIIR